MNQPRNLAASVRQRLLNLAESFRKLRDRSGFRRPLNLVRPIIFCLL
jgi:hypothetical protein